MRPCCGGWLGTLLLSTLLFFKFIPLFGLGPWFLPFLLFLVGMLPFSALLLFRLTRCSCFSCCALLCVSRSNDSEKQTQGCCTNNSNWFMLPPPLTNEEKNLAWVEAANQNASISHQPEICQTRTGGGVCDKFVGNVGLRVLPTNLSHTHGRLGETMISVREMRRPSRWDRARSSTR
jgi:hypothetical protein